MKKLLYTLLAVSFIFTACKKEDEATTPVTTPTSSIIGTWEATEMEMNLEWTIDGAIVLDSSWVVDAVYHQYKYHYKADGTLNQYDLTDDLQETGNWSLSGDILTMSTSTNSAEFDLVSISTTTMVQFYTVTEISNGQTSITDQTITYTKVNDILTSNNNNQ
jgi:hypothetical protein